MGATRTASAALIAAAVWALASLADAPPAVDPAQARLDQTVKGLDGPGFAAAYQADSGLLIVGCEKGSLQYWRKDVVMGVRVGDTAPHTIPAHNGPVLSVAACGGLFA